LKLDHSYTSAQSFKEPLATSELYAENHRLFVRRNRSWGFEEVKFLV